MARMAKVSILILFIFGSLAANHSLPQTSTAQQGNEQHPVNQEPATVLKATTRLVVVDVVATAHDKAESRGDEGHEASEKESTTLTIGHENHSACEPNKVRLRRQPCRRENRL